MRFPIITEKTEFGINFKNLSEALQESLRDMKIIDPKTYELKQKYFDLPIKEGHLLDCLSDFFELQGNFHVGCGADARPPSFGFYISKGDSETREGNFYLSYSRKLKLSVFFEKNVLRNKKGVRDLESLAKAYNQIGNYEETVGVGWQGWTGSEYKEKDWRGHEVITKTGFSGSYIGMEFDGKFFKEFRGIDNLEEGDDDFGPLYGNRSPFYEFAKNTRISEITKEYCKQKGKLEDYRSGLMYGYILPHLCYQIGDVLFGILQIVGKIFPVRKNIEQSQNKIVEACSGYKPVPRDFDFSKENKLYFELMGS